MSEHHIFKRDSPPFLTQLSSQFDLLEVKKEVQMSFAYLLLVAAAALSQYRLGCALGSPVADAYKNSPAGTQAIVNQTTCAGTTFTYQSLAGYGFVASNFTDKYNDTVSIGSSIAVDRTSWKKLSSTQYEGTFYLLPDRGW